MSRYLDSRGVIYSDIEVASYDQCGDGVIK
jgi:hypothetical protein